MVNERGNSIRHRVKDVPWDVKTVSSGFGFDSSFCLIIPAPNYATKHNFQKWHNDNLSTYSDNDFFSDETKPPSELLSTCHQQGPVTIT